MSGPSSPTGWKPPRLWHDPGVATLVISYARVDQRQVRAIVALLKAALRDIERAVFWDGEFEPGEPWFDQIKRHIDKAPQLFVFWCEHSSSSAQVRREFEYAFQVRKRVVPVLLDDTTLCDELTTIAGIDLRGAVVHGQLLPSLPRPPNETRSPVAPTLSLRRPKRKRVPSSQAKRKKQLIKLSAAVILAAALLGASTLAFRLSIYRSPYNNVPTSLGHPQFGYWWILALLLILAFLFSIGAWNELRGLLKDLWYRNRMERRSVDASEMRQHLERRSVDSTLSEAEIHEKIVETMLKLHYDIGVNRTTTTLPPREVPARWPAYINPSARSKIIEQFAAHIQPATE